MFNTVFNQYFELIEVSHSLIIHLTLSLSASTVLRQFLHWWTRDVQHFHRSSVRILP